MKRPTGMNREVYALLYSDKNDAYVIKLYLSYHGDEDLMLLLHTHPPPPPHTHTHTPLSHTLFSLTQQFPLPHSHRHRLWLPPAQSSAGQKTCPPLEVDAVY